MKKEFVKDCFGRLLFPGDRVKFKDGDKGFVTETRRATGNRIRVKLDEGFIDGWVCEEYAFKINYL